MNAHEFVEQYEQSFLDLIKIPFVTCCKYQQQLIPYEYAPQTQRLKVWRTEKALRSYFKTHPKFLAFCLHHGITKYFLQVIQGGNLLLFKQKKEIGF